MSDTEGLAEHEVALKRTEDLTPVRTAQEQGLTAPVPAATLTEDERESLRLALAKWSKSEGRVGAMQRDIEPAMERILAARQPATVDAETLLNDYDPLPGLVARGVASDEHDPDSCEADCCCGEGYHPATVDAETRCEGLAPFRCGNPSCPVHGSTGPTLPFILRVPTDRVDNPDGMLNVGAAHHEVEVVIDPTIETLGLHEPAYGRDTIRLREWNEQVLLHELLHVAVSRSAWWSDLQRQIDDPNGHDVISRIEVALWETGWRLVPAPTTEGGRPT